MARRRQTFDFVVVGGGSAGCVLANRLSADRSVRVLLLEAGGHDRHPFIGMPLLMPKLLEKKRLTWGHKTDPEPHCQGRSIDLPTGRVIGGSSSINAMLYVRGHPFDYDDWDDSGTKHWSYADALPFFKRSESNWRGASEYHGGRGELRVSSGSSIDGLYEAFAEAANNVGFPATEDYNGQRPEGVGRPDFTIGDGMRSSAARAFLRPALARSNLLVRTNAIAHRLLIDHGRATGVEFLEGGRRYQAKALREVVLACGTYNTPQLLMLSGIGPARHLEAFGLRTVLDRPEVGRNLQDHPNALLGFELSHPTSLQRVLRFDRMACAITQWALSRRGPVASFPTSAIGFLRTVLATDRPDFSISVTAGGTDHLWFPGVRRPAGHRAFARITALHPASRGQVFLQSASPLVSPRVSMGLLSSKKDVDTLREGVTATRAIFADNAWAQIVRRESWPGRSVRSSAAVDRWLTHTCGTAYHGSGTCRMGADDQAIVDYDLKVRGIDCLRVADCSIMPKLVGANTNATAMMIAEKAATLLQQKLET